MPSFKKLSDCFLFQSINSGTRAQIINEMGNQAFINSNKLPEELVNEHLATITRRYKFQDTIQIVELAKQGRIIVMASENSKIPAFIPCWLVRENNEVCAVVNASPYTKIQKNDCDIDVKRFFGLLQIGMLNLKAYSAYNKIVNSVPLLTTLCKIYTRLMMKVLDRNYAVNLDKAKADQISYLIAKFFLINCIGRTDSTSTQSIALNCVTNGIASENQLKRVEEEYNIKYDNIAVFFDSDLPTAFNSLREMTFRAVLETYCKMYGDFNFMSIEYFYNFLAFIISCKTSSSFGNDSLALSIAGNEIDSVFRLVTNILA